MLSRLTNRLIEVNNAQFDKDLFIEGIEFPNTLKDKLRYGMLTECISEEEIEKLSKILNDIKLSDDESPDEKCDSLYKACKITPEGSGIPANAQTLQSVTEDADTISAKSGDAKDGKSKGKTLIMTKEDYEKLKDYISIYTKASNDMNDEKKKAIAVIRKFINNVKAELHRVNPDKPADTFITAAIYSIYVHAVGDKPIKDEKLNPKDSLELKISLIKKYI